MVNLKRTREDILSAVLDLIHHQGFHATGLKELFTASGSSSGSFYNYFSSKNDLAHALIDFKWDKMKATIINPTREAIDDPISQVFWMIDQLEMKHLAEPECAGCFLGNLIVDLVDHDPSFQEHLGRVFDEWHGAIAHCLHAGQTQLQLGTDPDTLAEQLLAMIEGTLLLGRLYSNQPDRLKRGFEGVRHLLRSALQ